MGRPAKRFGQRPQRGGRAVVGPVQIVEAQQQRLVHGGALEQRFDVCSSQTLLRRGVLIAQESGVEQRRIVLEQRFEERGQLDDAIGGSPCRGRHECRAR